MTTPRTGRRLGRTTVMLTTALATMVGTLVTLGATSVPAQAEFDETQKWGYAKVIEPEAYLLNYIHAGVEILHVDTEHMDADGFWFAEASNLSSRGFSWRYQPFGMWCSSTVLKVQWNPWLNTNACDVDYSLTEGEYPGYADRTAACRVSTGHPWKNGNSNADYDPANPYCGNSTLSMAGPITRKQEPGQPAACAPWETTGMSASGVPSCSPQSYPWVNGTPNTFWTPAPDTCTGMPENANRVYANPDSYVPAGPVRDCTGEALASNCPTGSVNQGCTGVPQPTPPAPTATATATITVAVNDGTGTASATKSATQKAVAYKATKTVKVRYAGKVYKATKTSNVYATATKTATASVTLTNGNAAHTATMSCTSTTMLTAKPCAEANARAEALTAARIAADAEATTRAQTQAAPVAIQQAKTAALQAAKTSPITTAAKQAAAKTAKAIAVKAVKKQIAKAKKRR